MRITDESEIRTRLKELKLMKSKMKRVKGTQLELSAPGHGSGSGTCDVTGP